MREIKIGKGTAADLNELEGLYDELNDSLAAGINYPGWIKGVYPVRRSAEEGLRKNALYVARSDGSISGSVILSHEPEPGYEGGRWTVMPAAGYDKIIVIHTLVVHPAFQGQGIGRALMDFAFQTGKEQGMESIRLDVYEKNLPAVRLYESCGFRYVGTIDLGLGDHGLDWFRLYEKSVI